MKKIKIVSRTSAMVSLYVPDLHIHRLFEKEGEVFLLPEDSVEEMFYYPGVENLFRKGYLQIEDDEMNEKLGLSDDGKPNFLNTTQIKAALVTKNPVELKEYMETFPSIQQQRFADYAIENKLTDYNKCKVIKEVTGRDVIKTIELTAED